MSATLDFDYHFRTAVSRDLAMIVLGQSIAVGTFRHVYEHETDANLVVKIESAAVTFYNAIEYTVWQAVKNTPYAKWFAPVEKISPCGCVLFMRRTTEPRVNELPKKLPVFLSDFKRENFGLLNGKFVCHDYGHNNLIQRGLSNKLVKINWD